MNSMKRALCLALILTVLFVTLSLQARAAFSWDVSASQATDEWLVFIDSANLFSLSHPQGWFVHEGEVIVFSPSEEVSQDVSALSETPTLVIMPGAQVFDQGMTPQDALHFWIEALRSNWGQVKVSEDPEAKVDGRAAGGAFITGTDRLTGIAFKMYLLLFGLAGRNCLTLAIAPLAQWDTAGPILTTMLSTLHLLTPEQARMSKPELEFGKKGEISTDLAMPHGVGVGPTGWVYVLDAGRDRIQVYDEQGALQFAFGEPGSKLGQFNFANAGGLALDADGDVYVVDRGNQRVQVFDPQGKPKLILGAGRLKSPQGVAVDSAGRVYVTDEGTHSVEAFYEEGARLVKLSHQMSSAPLESPRAIATGPQDHVYVTDLVGLNVLSFDNAGHFLATLGSRGSEASYLAWPVGIAVDAAGTIYVADKVLGVIKQFDSKGQQMAAFGRGPRGEPITPTALALDARGRLYVCDAAKGRVLRFNLAK
jgi:DNA-binding beta-propeller fold protein YncE